MSISLLSKRIGSANFAVGVTGLIQIGSSMLSFVMVPLLMRYLSTQDYGLWVTLISLIGWIGIFDFGIGYSFKNKVTEFLVDHDEAKINKLFVQCLQYYVIISLMILVLFFVLLFTVPILSDHKLLSILVYVPAILIFPLNVSGQILQGLRLTHFNSLYAIIKAILWAVFIAVLAFSGQESNLVLTTSAFSILSVCFSAFIFLIAIRKSQLHLPQMADLLQKPVFDETIKTGLQFFVLQVSALLFFSMGNFYIYSNLSPKDTIDYDTTNKIFTFYFTFINTLISVYWSEIVYYKSLNDYPKLKKIYKNLFLFSLLFSAGAWVLTLVAPLFIRYWTNGRVMVETINCIPFAILITCQSIAYVGAVFLNAFEKVKPQIVTSVISMALLYPLITYGFEHNWKIATPPLVSAILTIPALIVCHIFANRLIDTIKPLHEAKSAGA